MDSLAKSEADEVFLQEKTELSFDENILKLCEGLRAKGFDKHAEELENKFVSYKAAANTHLYRVHDEDGEDQVHAAHPDGDAPTNDGDLGDVETIVSKHKKIVDVIQKEPTGKLGAYVEQCKIALGQQQAGMQAKAFLSSLAGPGAKLYKGLNFINSMTSQPEFANDENLTGKFSEVSNAISSLTMWLGEVFKMAEAKKGTELNPSLALVTADDVNTILSQDKRYAEFAGILNVGNPAELSGKLSQVVTYVKTKLTQIINSIENPEVKKNILVKLQSSGM